VCRNVTRALVNANEEIVLLDKNRKIVMSKTMGLHEECEALLKEQNLLDEYASALSARLERFDGLVDVTRVLERNNPANDEDFPRVLR
jgi:c-di-GMP-related signal transduction protein